MNKALERFLQSAAAAKRLFLEPIEIILELGIERCLALRFREAQGPNHTCVIIGREEATNADPSDYQPPIVPDFSENAVWKPCHTTQVYGTSVLERIAWAERRTKRAVCPVGRYEQVTVVCKCLRGLAGYRL